ncbi:MAG: hypothetical protein ABI990_11270, partial [Actinomycetota bacterium]
MSAVPAARPRRLSLDSGLGRTLVRVGMGIALLLLWEGLVHWFSQSYVARPSGVVHAFPHVVRNGEFWHATRMTAVAIAEGLAIGIIGGGLVGLV